MLPTLARLPDLDAPILPGLSAAGVQIGESIERIPNLSEIITEMGGVYGFHKFNSVKVWSRSGIVVQMGVSEGYRGMVGNRIGIGSTIADVESWTGSEVAEGEDDELIAVGSAGWSFEMTEWNGTHKLGLNREARIVAIFVHR